ncbi:MAG: MmgE/PrpD family protein [Phycisphaerae bacterium]
MTKQLCDWLGQLDHRPLPEPVSHEVKRRVLDTIGVAVAGWDGEPCRITREQAQEVQALDGGATVWGTRHRAPAALAAFANGTQARYLDYNDTYLSLEPAHPSDNIPACLAVGEGAGVDGRRVMTAIAAAYEIQCRLCDAAGIREKGWDHVVYGAISVAATAGWLWGLRGEALGHAISLGVVSNIAMRQTRVGQLSHWKGCAFANAARNAIFGADLARRGMIGPADPFTGAMGLFKQVTGPFRIYLPEGEDWAILQTYIKFYPADYCCQSAIEAALCLRQAIPDTAAIARVDVDTFDVAVDITGSEPEKWDPTSRETADQSMPYCVAAALLDAHVSMESFNDRRRADPQLRELIRRVAVHRDPGMNHGYPDGTPTRVRVTLRDGQTLAHEIKYPRGHAGNPMTDEEVREKFVRMTSLRLAVPARARLQEAIWGLETVENLTGLFELMASE